MEENYIDKYDREFPSKEAYEQFLNQADAVGRWEQKNGVPEGKRLTWWYSDFGVHVPNYWVARNDIAEKFNEITGRKMQPELDPLFEIRSSVHSNYAGMVAMLGADDRVYLGREENLRNNLDEDGFYNNRDGSLCHVSDMPEMYYFLYGDGWHHSQDEMLERGLTVEHYAEFDRMQNAVLGQFEQTRQLQFAGQPFKAPVNYLRNAELDLEAEGGNYNMANDGLINNQSPVRADLTDGQTHDEIVELAPETLQNDKPSVLERLKAGGQLHSRQEQPAKTERAL